MDSAKAMRCSISETSHHNLKTYLTAYIDGAGLAEDPKGPLFRTLGRDKGRPLTQITDVSGQRPHVLIAA